MPNSQEPKTKPNTGAEMVPVTNDELQQMRDFTGESNMERRPNVPFIKFSGKTGDFSKQTSEVGADGKSVYAPLGKALEAVIIKMRKSISTKMDAVESYYSYEFDTYDDLVTVYDRATGQEWGTGTYRELKNKNTSLQLNEVVYLYHPEDKKVYRMLVKGASLSPLWEYVRGIPKDDTVLRYVTRFSPVGDKSPKGIPYFKLAMERGPETTEWRTIFDQLKQLSIALSRRSQRKVALLNAGQPTPVDDEPVIDVSEDAGSDGEEKIDVSKIPF